MGYTPQITQYELLFEEYPGLEITIRGCSLGEITYVSGLKPDVREADEAKRTEIFRFFAERLITWNIQHPIPSATNEDGRCKHCGLAKDDAMPPTVQSMHCLELAFIMKIIINWIFTMVRASAPKGWNSSDGVQNILTDSVMKQLETLESPGTSLPQNYSLD